MKNKKIKHTVKASIFEDLFSDKNYLLDLYKTLFPDDITITQDDLRIVTIKNIFSNGRYNDLGFLVRNKVLILIEAQSTWSPNIIVRSYLYSAITVNEDFEHKDINIYGSSLVDIPVIKLFVIYTGNKKNRRRLFIFK